MHALPDGSYECIVVDVEEEDDGSTRVALTITAGTRKGEMLSLRAASLARDALELLGLPATVDVRDGKPSVTW